MYGFGLEATGPGAGSHDHPACMRSEPEYQSLTQSRRCDRPRVRRISLAEHRLRWYDLACHIMVVHYGTMVTIWILSVLLANDSQLGNIRTVFGCSSALSRRLYP